MRKLAILLAMGIMITSMTACTGTKNVKNESSKVEIQSEEKEKIAENSSVETTNVDKNVEEISSNEENLDELEGYDYEAMEENRIKYIKENFKSIAEGSKKVLIDNSKKIDEEFDLKDVQLLLVSNLTGQAYLINSQNEKYGSKDELVEYSSDTFKESLLTNSFGIIQFNDRETYILNIDLFSYGANLESGKRFAQDMVKVIVHEGTHMLLQSKLEESETLVTGESLAGDRAVKHEIDSKSREYRAQQAYAYKNAILAEDSEVRVEWIKKGNYFYKKFLEENPQNGPDSELDKIEGQATYYEYKTLAVLNDKADDQKTLEKSARKYYVDQYKEIQDEYLMNQTKGREIYTIGSLGYANIYALGIQSEFGYQNPSRFLLKKYGVIENKGNKNIEEGILKFCKEMNDGANGIKDRVDTFTSQLESDEYQTIKIPRYSKYEQNQSMSFGNQLIAYNYLDEEMTLQSRMDETKLGNARILMKSQEVLSSWGSDETMVEVLYTNIKKDDLEIKNGKVSVQLPQIKFFDCPYHMEGDLMVLDE
ncbi:MAG: hypothetical protein N4A40_04955 [Tissierellales bacterium]|jgi:hypothetical protein|nr:hypothetical protein [Tissierellales bacterium]